MDNAFWVRLLQSHGYCWHYLRYYTHSEADSSWRNQNLVVGFPVTKVTIQCTFTRAEPKFFIFEQSARFTYCVLIVFSTCTYRLCFSLVLISLHQSYLAAFLPFFNSLYIVELLYRSIAILRWLLLFEVDFGEKVCTPKPYLYKMFLWHSVVIHFCVVVTRVCVIGSIVSLLFMCSCIE